MKSARRIVRRRQPEEGIIMASSPPRARQSRALTEAEAMRQAMSALETARLSLHDDPQARQARHAGMPWPEIAVIALALAACAGAIVWRAAGF